MFQYLLLKILNIYSAVHSLHAYLFFLWFRTLSATQTVSDLVQHNNAEQNYFHKKKNFHTHTHTAN